MLRDIVKNLQMERGWSKKEAASACGLSYDAYINITLGRREALYPETLKKLSKGFGVSVAILLGEKQDELDIVKLKETLKDYSREQLITMFKAMDYTDREVELLLLIKEKPIPDHLLIAMELILKGPP